MNADPHTSRKIELIRRATGPAPWYVETFPQVLSATGQPRAWTLHGKDSALPYLVSLGVPHQPEHPRLALNTYCRPFLTPDGKLGVWCPEPRETRVVVFPPDLVPFAYEAIAGWFKQSSERIYSATPPIAEMSVDAWLPEGTHKVEVPAELRSVSELLMVNSYPAKTRDDAAAAVFVLRPAAGEVEVLPQKWFTNNAYDVGQQWISRMVRDPETGRLLGEAVRVGMFELDEGGMHVQQWLEKHTTDPQG